MARPHDQEALSTALLETSLDGIILVDSEGIILRANSKACKLFNRPLVELVGHQAHALVPALRHKDRLSDDNHNTGRPSRSIITGAAAKGLRSDGSTFPLQLAIGETTVNDKTAYVVTLHDLTRRHAMEAAASRSQRLDAIGRMTGGVAHDFNNLLTVIIGNLELLAPSLPNDKAQKLVADALTAAELGADLTARLTAFARKQPLYARLIDFNQTVASATALLKHTVSARCHIELLPGNDLWPVRLDSTQLQTAVLNLALNAQDAMPAGGRIVIETNNIEIDDTYLAQELDVATGRYVRLTVSDTGEGMDPEQRALALEPFFTTKPIGKGTGLGLSMVYGFTKQSGGHVTLYSEAGQGTTVSLYFPVAQTVGDAPDDTNIKVQALPDTISGKVILIVEDDARLRRLTQTRLAAMGFACMTAATADEAWQIITNGTPIDLVFTDMVMPGDLSGYDLATKVADAYPDLPVLITSGFSENVLQGQTLGSDFAILRKPYRQADLAKAIYEALGKQAL